MRCIDYTHNNFMLITVHRSTSAYVSYIYIYVITTPCINVPSHPLLYCVYNPSYTHQGYKALKRTAKLMSLTCTSSILHFPNSLTSTLGTSTSGSSKSPLIDILSKLQYRLGVYVGATVPLSKIGPIKICN